MNINKKYIIIFGTLILLLLIITGAITYYNERKSEETIKILTRNHPTFYQNYPVTFEEADSFQKFCGITATPSFMSSIPSLLDEEVIEEKIIVNRCCIMKEKDTTDSEDKYILAFNSLGKVSVLRQGEYIAISINLNDLFEKNAPLFLSEENSFNLCVITNPSLIGPFREELLLKNQININRNIVFSEGELFCTNRITEDTSNKMMDLSVSGFVPKTDLFQVKIYLIPEDSVVNQLFSQESFANIENILQSYPILWNVEKPVI